MTSLSRTWQWWAATASAVCVARLGAVANWRCSWPIANMRACQWRTFWTYLVTVNLFSLYLMNFMFHTTLDAVGNILRVQCKSMKCGVSFSQVSVSRLRYLSEVNIFFHVFLKNVLPVYSSAKIIFKNQTSFSRVVITHVLPRFNESQCIFSVKSKRPLNVIVKVVYMNRQIRVRDFK